MSYRKPERTNSGSAGLFDDPSITYREILLSLIVLFVFLSLGAPA